MTELVSVSHETIPFRATRDVQIGGWMTDKELLKDYYSEAQVAKIMGISVGRLRNKIGAQEDHPPFTGKGKGRRFPIDEFKKWEKARLVFSRRKPPK